MDKETFGLYRLMLKPPVFEANPIIWTLIYSKFEGIDSCILQGLVLLILL